MKFRARSFQPVASTQPKPETVAEKSSSTHSCLLLSEMLFSGLGSLSSRLFLSRKGPSSLFLVPCFPDPRDQPLLHPDLCGGSRGAAPHRPPAVLLQALQGHWPVPSSCQHHVRIQSQCRNLFTGDAHRDHSCCCGFFETSLPLLPDLELVPVPLLESLGS